MTWSPRYAVNLSLLFTELPLLDRPAAARALERHLAGLGARGYAGWVGLEYTPSGTSADSFAWLPREQRGSR